MLQVRGGWGARVGPRRNSPGGELEIRDATPRVLLQHRVEPTNRPRDTWKDGRWDFEPLPLPSPRLQAPAVSMPATPVILATRGPSCAIWCRPVTSVTGSSVAHYRSEEGRVGKAGVRKCRSRWSRSHNKKNKSKKTQKGK